jgi:hypothetical protein
MKAKSIVDRAGIILHDTTKVRWLEAELLGWLNDAQREVVLLRPDASITNDNVNLIAGTKQSLPASGIRVMDVVRNTDGNAIRVIDRNVLDAQQPNWHQTSANNDVAHFMFDLRDPKHFYVYPPQPTIAEGETANQVEIIYSASPQDVTFTAPATQLDDEDVALDDIYGNAILDYVLYRAYSKDADFAGNAQRALKHYETFVQSLGLKFQVDRLTDPNFQGAPVPQQPQ